MSFGTAAGKLTTIKFYSAQIFLIGAEFTKLFAAQFGSNILPDKMLCALSSKKPNRIIRFLNASLLLSTGDYLDVSMRNTRIVF